MLLLKNKIIHITREQFKQQSDYILECVVLCCVVLCCVVLCCVVLCCVVLCCVVLCCVVLCCVVLCCVLTVSDHVRYGKSDPHHDVS
jgi:hypothetical protein